MSKYQMEEVLHYFACKYQGNYQLIIKALVDKEMIDEAYYEYLKQINKENYITIISENYPESLKNIDAPPIVLFYKGDISLLNGKKIAVIGMRNNSSYGEKVTKNFVQDLVKYEYTIVSGLAKGIDGIAHETAIVNNGKTIGILGCGIDQIYPMQNKEIYQKMEQSQLILSEYPARVLPTKDKFPARNRIIAGLSQAILVTEAKKRSGTMITVGYGLDQGKTIFCIPSPINMNNGTNSIIQQGGCLVISVEDILEELAF